MQNNDNQGWMNNQSAQRNGWGSNNWQSTGNMSQGTYENVSQGAYTNMESTDAFQNTENAGGDWKNNVNMNANQSQGAFANSTGGFGTGAGGASFGFSASQVTPIGIDVSKKSVFGFSIMLYGVLACFLVAGGYSTALLSLLMVIALLEKDTDKNLIIILVSMLSLVLALDVCMTVVVLIKEPIEGVVSTLFAGADYGTGLYKVKEFLRGGLNSIVSIIRWVKNVFLLYYGVVSMKNIKNGTFKPAKFVANWVK